MIHPPPVYECTVYQRASGVTELVVAIDGTLHVVQPAQLGLEIAAASLHLPLSSPPDGPGVDSAISKGIIAADYEAASPIAPPRHARAGARHWLTIIALTYGIASVLSCILLALMLRHDERIFNSRS